MTTEIHADSPQPGYYKMRNKAGYWVPIAIWRKSDGSLYARDWDRPYDPYEIWTWVAKTPIEKSVAMYAFENHAWEDMPADIGDNLPPDDYEALTETVKDRLEIAKDWLESHPDGATTEIEANMARNMEAQIQELLKRANEMHEAEKRPHLDASRAVDGRYAFRKVMDPYKKALKNAWGVYAVAEEKRREAEAAAERERILKERAEKEQNDPIGAILDDHEPLPEAKKVNVGGGVGTRGGLTTKWRFEIEDWKMVAVALCNHHEVEKAIEKVVAAAVRINKGNTQIPGVRVWDERAAK